MCEIAVSSDFHHFHRGGPRAFPALMMPKSRDCKLLWYRDAVLAPTLALALVGSSGLCNIKAHVVDVKTGNGVKSIEVFVYEPSNPRSEQKAVTDASRDVCLTFSAPLNGGIYVGTYASRYRSVAPGIKIQSLPHDLTIQVRRIGPLKAFGTRALGH